MAKYHKPGAETAWFYKKLILRGPRGQAIDRFIVRKTGFSWINTQFAFHSKERPFRAVVLSTVGAKSGEVRDNVLPYTGILNGALIVHGSFGGGPRHPSWTFNLIANPDCWITVRRERYRAVGRILTGEERKAALTAIGYERRGALIYDRLARERYDRETRVVALIPLSPLPRKAYPAAPWDVPIAGVDEITGAWLKPR